LETVSANPRDNEYQKLLTDVFAKRLPQAFVANYFELQQWHDLYLEDIYIANTGKTIEKYSRPKHMSVQLGLYTGERVNRTKLRVVYQNVYEFSNICTGEGALARFSPTAFGRVMCSRFDLSDNKLWQGIRFERGTMEICFERLYFRKIRETGL
jgi:hypothetical protein